MSLEMRAGCERCDAILAPDGPAFICSFECTFCEGCADETDRVCPNRGGVVRSRRKRR